ncbi:MAG: hypothetical protein BGO63_19000 [Candidatus Accumulibacter sp. 66-26]|nr:hypothetical protein [Accumulibacter sp.]OJW51975.1 MAG: hypothetical protein BGO63_19000 [Candidatus Accumulibacter sp. 66-26]
METAPENSRLTLHEAARLLAAPSIHDAELELAHAIEDGRLHANVKRWATEQWESGLLPGNINRLETWIERSDFEAWVAARQSTSEAKSG